MGLHFHHFYFVLIKLFVVQCCRFHAAIVLRQGLGQNVQEEFHSLQQQIILAQQQQAAAANQAVATDGGNHAATTATATAHIQLEFLDMGLAGTMLLLPQDVAQASHYLPSPQKVHPSSSLSMLELPPLLEHQQQQLPQQQLLFVKRDGRVFCFDRGSFGIYYVPVPPAPKAHVVQ
ncbi:hypothetical protein ACA910_022371 [Epithemia clementina (nom. ined.)]